MSLSEEVLSSGSGSFWEVESYKRTVKRHEDGYKLCESAMALITERADLEKKYAKSLREWSKKWNTAIENGPEYGTTAASWKGVCTESDRLADLHITIKDRLVNTVHSEVKQWRSDHYKKSIVGHSKETKDLEEDFKKAQKPWAKRLSKVLKAKKEYHNACKLEKSATNQENNARVDSTLSPDQLKKLQDKVEKYKRDVNITKEKYESTLNDLNSYNAKYMEEMTEAFEKSQEYESKRLKFFKEILYGVHKAINISANPQCGDIYNQFEETIGLADYQKDLKYWATYHGVEMPMAWPAFEEYSPEMHSIHKKRGGGSHHGDGITLTGLHHKTDTLPPTNGMSAPPSQNEYNISGYDNGAVTQTPVVAKLTKQQSYDNTLNPFGDDDDDEVSADETNSTHNESTCDSVQNESLNVSIQSDSPSDHISRAQSNSDSQSIVSNVSADIKSTSSCEQLTGPPKPPRVTPKCVAKPPAPKPPGHSDEEDVYDASLNPFGDDGTDLTPEAEDNKEAQNPFGGDDDGWQDSPDYEGDFADLGEPVEGGTSKVRAIYSYTAGEDDEISFNVGDEFVKLRNKNKQGWCLGEINGKVGLYPDNYIEVL